jgi:hypothetical protein
MHLTCGTRSKRRSSASILLSERSIAVRVGEQWPRCSRDAKLERKFFARTMFYNLSNSERP